MMVHHTRCRADPAQASIMLSRPASGRTVEAASGPAQRRFELILIKPSHYDDDGYVIQWFMSAMPSNSLAALYGLAADAEARRVLGHDTAINVTVIDETNTRIKPHRLIRRIVRNGGFGMVGLVGVQSNQYPRALDIARPLRAAGIPVVIGGFHVSGTIAMLPVLTPDLQEALDLGVSLFAGEAEERFDELLRDAADNTLKPVYNYMRELPNIQAVPLPFSREQRSSARSVAGRRSMPAAVARSSVRSAPSSMSKGANPAAVLRTMLRRSSGTTTKTGSRGSLSPMTISLATRIGSRSWTASSRCGKRPASMSG
jgi:hypothetical protein